MHCRLKQSISKAIHAGNTKQLLLLVGVRWFGLRPTLNSTRMVGGGWSFCPIWNVSYIRINSLHGKLHKFIFLRSRYRTSNPNGFTLLIVLPCPFHWHVGLLSHRGNSNRARCVELGTLGWCFIYLAWKGIRWTEWMHRGKMGKIHFKDCVRNNFTLNDYELVLSWIFYSSLHRFCFHGAFPVHNFPILRGFSLIAYWIVRRQTMIDGTWGKLGGNWSRLTMRDGYRFLEVVDKMSW